MNRSEIKTALKAARQHRENLDFEAALSILHQVVNEYPEDIYLYLLAATYLEAGSEEAAMEYADKVLEKNDKYKEAYELKGVIYEKDNEFEEAEKMYLKALDTDYDFFDARTKLVNMYYSTQRYEDIIRQCEFVLSYKQFDYSTTKKLVESTKWQFAFFYPLYVSYIYLKKYDDAIRILLKYKELEAEAGVDDGFNLHLEDEILYKLFYLTNNQEKLKEYRDLWLNHYKVSEDKLKRFEEKANNGKIV